MSEQEARDPATSTERLEELSNDPALRILVASNPAAPASLLEILATDQDAQVREQVAGNPNTPWPILEQLAWEFPRAFLHNPVGQLQMLAHPEQINITDTFWDMLLREASIPLSWWNWLENHPTLRWSTAMGLHVQYVGETTHLHRIAREGDAADVLTLVELLTAAFVQGVFVPPLPASEITGQAMACEQIVEKHRRWLVHRSDGDVHLRLAEHPQTPAEILSILAQDAGSSVRGAVASHRQTPVEVLATLAQDADANVRCDVARNPQTPVVALATLARDPEADVRDAVAGNLQTPVEVLCILAQDAEADVRETVASHPQTPVEVLCILARDADGKVRAKVAGNRQTPAEVLATLARDTEADEEYGAIVRLAVASHPQTPVKVLCTLAQDQAEGVRAATAKHPQIPTEVLLALAQDADAMVRLAVARHAQTPVLVLWTLAQDQHELVRRTVAGNPQTPLPVLRTLAQDSSGEVREAVAQHAQTPMEVLVPLAQDSDAGVRFLANAAQKLLLNGQGRLSVQGWSAIYFFQHDAFAATTIIRQPIERQLEMVASSNIPVDARQTIIEVLAADWQTTTIQGAFSGNIRLRPEKDTPMRLSSIMGYLEREDYEHILASYMPALALQKLAISPRWEVRYLVALHDKTPPETRQRLSQDGNRYVRAMAKAKAEMVGEPKPHVR